MASADFQTALTFFLLEISPTMYILRKSSDFELFEKQHHGTPKSNKNNTLSKYAFFEKLQVGIFSFVGRQLFRPIEGHYFLKRVWRSKKLSHTFWTIFWPIYGRSKCGLSKMWFFLKNRDFFKNSSFDIHASSACNMDIWSVK